MHFDRLNYSFANENTLIELSYLPDHCESVFCIAGSGARVIPLLSKNPKVLDVYDSSLPQLYLAELRYLAVKQLSYEDYLVLLGYQRADKNIREQIFERLTLSTQLKQYWSKTNTEWKSRGFIYIGRWERKLYIFSKLFSFFHFKNIEKMFLENNFEKFPKKTWDFFCKLILQEFLVRKLFYSGQSKYDLSVPFGRFIYANFLRQIKRSHKEDNFFLPFVFCRKILGLNHCPAEVHTEIFNLSKRSTTQVRFIQQNLIEQKKWDYSFYSLSDCFSYLPSEVSQNIILQISNSKTACSGVLRFFMYEPSLPWSKLAQVETIDASKDCVPIYRR
jgi:S-adenosylmethionine-diacylglycerol 3-amino-3-carboxypropyl transferase